MLAYKRIYFFIFILLSATFSFGSNIGRNSNFCFEFFTSEFSKNIEKIRIKVKFQKNKNKTDAVIIGYVKNKFQSKIISNQISQSAQRKITASCTKINDTDFTCSSPSKAGDLSVFLKENLDPQLRLSYFDFAKKQWEDSADQIVNLNDGSEFTITGSEINCNELH